MGIRDFAKKFIEAENEAWYNGNCDALAKLEDPNAVYHLLALDQETSGWEAHKQYILSARQGFSNFQHEWKYLTGEGNYFALTYRMSCLFDKNIPGFPPPTGKEMKAYSLFLFRLQNGKIAEAWSNGSVAGLG